MIHYIKIANFGSIRDEVELNFEVQDEDGSPAYEVEMPDKRRLLKLLYIYGANASGKTTVLRAFEFMHSLWLTPAYIKDDELRYDPFLFRPNADSFTSAIELSFYMSGLRYIYNVIFTKKAVHSEKLVVYRTHQPSELFSRTTDLEKRLSHVEFGAAVKGATSELNALATATLYNNSVLGAFQKTNVDLPIFDQLNVWGKNFLSPMIHAKSDLTEIASYNIMRNPEFSQWMNLFMNKADQQIREVSVKSDKSSRYEEIISRLITRPETRDQEQTLQEIAQARQVSFVHALKDNEVYALPLDKESNGSARYFGLGGVLYSLLTKSSFTAIDELDTSLHADLIKFFLQLFLLNSAQSQLVFTTHNVFLLEDMELIRRDALWFTEKDATGAVSLFSAADFDSATLRKGASLINAYKAGRLGAKPNLGSPYISVP